MNTAQEMKWIRRIKLFGSAKDADLLVRSYYDEIYGYVAKQLGDREFSYDLTQEIFISMLRSIASYREKQASFRTWLYRIATNKIIDYRRGARHNVILLADFDGAEAADDRDTADYEKRFMQAEFLRKIEQYVSGFQADVQQIFRLHIYGEQTFQEIAALTGMAETTVKSKYYRLMKQVKREFYEEYRENIGE